MLIKTIIKANAYFDSVTLMSISKIMKEIPGVAEAVVGMGTALNKELIEKVGLATADVLEAGPNDLMIAIKAEDEYKLSEALAAMETALARPKGVESNGRQAPKSLTSALELAPQSNIAIISLPGAYAAREAKKALENNLHVMLFSDNVSLQDEIALKKIAHDKGLLMMGPDCGTAIINNIPLCFANVVRAGNIGVVAASGTGAQEVMSLIDRLGGGVSQVIGTGGRDLHEAVGGIMMLDAIQALEDDERTSVIVIISKPPAPAIAQKILTALRQGIKAAVVYFAGGEQMAIEASGALAGSSLEDTARKAVALAQGQSFSAEDERYAVNETMLTNERESFGPGQKYVRALYTGGTLCDEAMLILGRELGSIYSNIALQPEFRLTDAAKSKYHTAVDLGDDQFTVGRPHPMIDPTIRLSRLLEEAHDPETAVLLLDVVLGYGAHADPAGILAPVIREAKSYARSQGRYLSVVASICGTYNDPQNFADQSAKLVSAGVVIADSNARAARVAALIVK